MSEWSLYGESRREEFEKNLEPESLYCDLNRYRSVLGNDFGICELLQLRDIQAKALIAESINDAPEFLIDQLGKARNSHNFPSLVRAIEAMTEVLEESSLGGEKNG